MRILPVQAPNHAGAPRRCAVTITCAAPRAHTKDRNHRTDARPQATIVNMSTMPPNGSRDPCRVDNDAWLDAATRVSGLIIRENRPAPRSMPCPPTARRGWRYGPAAYPLPAPECRPTTRPQPPPCSTIAYTAQPPQLLPRRWGTEACTRQPATRFSIAPMPSTSQRTTSPACRNRCGSMPTPTPSGVPVAIRSPVSSVNACDR